MSLMMVVVFIPTVAFGGSTDSCTDTCTHEAAIGTTHYDTLEEAVTAANGKEEQITITLLNNVQLESTVTFEKNAILNMNGKEITASSEVAVKNKGTLTITGNGIIDAKYPVRNGNEKGEELPATKSKLTITNGTFKSIEGAVTVRTQNSETIINGGTFSATDNAVVSCNGTSGYKNNVVTINGGTFNGEITTASYIACGIYAPNDDTITVNDGAFNITNGAGIVARGGNVVVKGGTFNTTGTATGWVGDNKDILPAATIVFDSKAAYPGLTDKSGISITGGKFASPECNMNIVKETSDVSKRITASGGSFSSKVPYEFCANGYVPTQKAVDGYYGVESFGKDVDIEESKDLTDTNVKSAIIAVDAVDAAKYAANANEKDVVTVKLTATSTTAETSGTDGAKAIAASTVGKASTIKYYTEVGLRYHVGSDPTGNEITSTSSFQTLVFNVSGCETSKVAVLRAHKVGTQQSVTSLPKVNKNDFDEYNSECYYVNDSEKLAYVKANKFSTYAIATQTTAPVAQCEVTFDSQGGSAVASQTISVGGTATEPATDPTKTGYVFKGWYADAAGTTAWNFSTAITANKTLYAKWVEAKTVTFNANGHGTAPATKTVGKGDLVTEPAAPTADGYIFKGWYKEAACTNAWNFATDKVTADITLYAKWVAATDISEFTVQLAAEKYAYDGTAKAPAVKLIDKDGKEVAAANYDVAYATGCTEIGEYAVTVTAKGEYIGTAKATFQIVPNTPTLKSVAKGKKSFTAKWTKNAEKITKYQLKYSTSSKFTSSKNKYTTSTKLKVKKLKAKKKYYVKVRAYKSVGGVKYYSDWSAVKRVKTK